MKRIAIITGITSFLGRSTAKLLIKKGFLVFGVTRPESTNNNSLKDINGLKLIYLDFKEIDAKTLDTLYSSDYYKKYIDIIQANDVDVSFIHFAWGNTTNRNDIDIQMKNVEYSMKVLRFACALNCNRFIFAGSQAEISKSPYGLAKSEFSRQAKTYLKTSNMKFLHLRIFSIYGAGDRDNSLIKQLVRNIRTGKDMKLSSCNYYWNYLYIDDFTDIIYSFIIFDAKDDVYDVASNDTRLLKDFCISAKNVYKSNIKLIFNAIPDKSEAFSLPDISKTLSATDKHSFVKFEKGVLKV